MKTPIFTGSCTAIVTPFTADFVNFERFGELIEQQIAAGTQALVVCGTTGEASTQTIPEHLATVEYAIKKADGRIKIIAGTGSNDTAHAVMMSQNAEKSGADGLLMVTPYYNKTTQKGLVKHFEYVADRVGIPIILYNIPGRTGMAISLDAYKELAKHPMINGTKEASGNLELLSQIINECGDDMNVWSGDDSLCLPMMALGAKGIISVLSNICPAETAELANACLAGDMAKARELHYKYYKLMKALFVETNPIPIKTAMNMMGVDVGPTRMPLCEMDSKNEAMLRETLKDYGLLK